MCRDIHTGAELYIFLLDGSIYLERTIGFVYFLSDGNHDTVKGLCPHSVYTKLYRAADLYVCKIFLVSSQAKHRVAFIDKFAKGFSRIDIFADVHRYISGITTNGGFDFQ